MAASEIVSVIWIMLNVRAAKRMYIYGRQCLGLSWGSSINIRLTLKRETPGHDVDFASMAKTPKA